MGILSDEEFLAHQYLLGDAYAGLVQARDRVQSGLALVVASGDPQVEVDLIDAYSTNLDTLEPEATSNLLASSTRALEAHIVDVSGQTFNDYLFTNGLKVTRDFADLSGYLGVPIDDTNIGS